MKSVDEKKYIFADLNRDGIGFCSRPAAPPPGWLRPIVQIKREQ